MAKKIFECWKAPDSTEITFTTVENATRQREQGLIPKNAFLEYLIEANTYE
jgi:hypothetical protein